MTTRNAYQATFRPSSEQEGGASVPFARLLGEEEFESDLRWADLCLVKPGAQIGMHEHLVDDEIYVILRGEAVMIVNGQERAVQAGDAVLLRCGGWHGLRNESGAEVHVLVIDVLAPGASQGQAPSGAERRPAWRNIGDVPLVSRRSSVGGVGNIEVGHLFDQEELGPAWDFVEYVVAPPGSSIGVHEHQGTEEIYYVLAGQGVMTINGEEIAFGPDTVSLCGSGSRHGLENRSDEAVKFLAIQVPGGQGTLKR